MQTESEQAETGERPYQVGEFAALTGVSIRTLHHYDQLGLLRPSHRSAAGYRFYTEQDLLRLQQILTLRYLGFALQQIHDLLDRADFDMLASLVIQRRVLRDRIRELERIDTALGELLQRRQATGHWEWALVAQTSATVQAELEQRGPQMSEQYTPEEMKARMAELAQQTPPEAIQQTEAK
ncbi:MAG: MerR family transcriptional regulator, partial [Ktedonobacterales bacterium]